MAPRRAVGDHGHRHRFSTGLLRLADAELRLFSSPFDLVTRETLPASGTRVTLPPGDYGIRLEGRLGPAAKEVVRVPPGAHVTVEVRLHEVWSCVFRRVSQNPDGKRKT